MPDRRDLLSAVPAASLALWLALASALAAQTGVARAEPEASTRPSPGALTKAIPFVEEFSGRLGFYAVTVDPDADTFEPLSVLRYNESARHPLASSFKLFVLLEVMHQLDAGLLGWDEHIEIPSSSYSLDGGRVPRRMKVSELVERMIVRSHNTSTDVLFKRVGLAAASQRLAELGLHGVRIVLPTREFWLGLSGLLPGIFPANGLPGAASAFAALPRSQQVEVAERIRQEGARFSARQIEQAVDEFYGFANYDQPASFAVLDDIDNVASPPELVAFVHHLYFANRLSQRWDAQMRQTLTRGDNAVDRDAIAVPLAYWGGKGGSDMGMGSVVGYAETARGRHVLYAITGSHMLRENADWRIIERLLGWAFTTLDAAP